jgi:hypothetical protein
MAKNIIPNPNPDKYPNWEEQSPEFRVAIARAEEATAEYNPGHPTRKVLFEDLERVAMLAADTALRQAFPQRSQAVFFIPNNFVGRIVRWILSRYLNRRVYKMRAFGRQPKRRGAGRGRPTIRHDEAKVLAIYIDTKRGWQS